MSGFQSRIKRNPCARFFGIQHPTSRTVCCSAVCGRYCGAADCQNGGIVGHKYYGEDYCCGSKIKKIGRKCGLANGVITHAPCSRAFNHSS